MIAALASPLARWAIGAAVGIGLIIAAYPYGDHKGATRVQDRHTVALQRAEIAAARITAAAQKRASVERAQDQQAITEPAKGLTDAIDKAVTDKPAPAIGAVSLAVGCERQRRAGATATARYRDFCDRR